MKNLVTIGLITLFLGAMAGGLYAQIPNAINVDVTVKNSDTGNPMPGVEINYFDATNNRIFVGKTNILGAFGFKVNNRPGTILRIEATFAGFIKGDFEGILRENDNRIIIKMVPKGYGPGDKISVSGHILNLKTQRTSNPQPVEGAEVTFFSNGRKIQGGFTDNSGYFIFYPDVQGGNVIEIRVTKEGFKLFKTNYTIKTGDNANLLPDIWIKPVPKLAVKWYGYGISGLAAISGAIYYAGYRADRKEYQAYQNFTDATSWNEKYKAANTKFHVFQGSCLVSGLALGAGVYFDIDEDLRNKKTNTNSGNSTPLNFYGVVNPVNGLGVGVRYIF